MASNEVDQKIIARLAHSTSNSDPFLSVTLFRVLGLVIMLDDRLIGARQQRKTNIPPDDKTTSLHHHITWLSREGLDLTESVLLPYSNHYSLNLELQILAAKLRASFYHVICLFHNQPAISHSHPLFLSSPLSSNRTASPLSPKSDNIQQYPRHRSPRVLSNTRKHSESAAVGKENVPARVGMLRDTIPSMASETSCITNPYAANSPSSPPGAPAQQNGDTPLMVPDAAAFLFPAMDYRPIAQNFFTHASTAATSLPITALLRMSIATEYAEFLSECARDREGSRQLARQTIKQVMTSDTDMRDADYEDAWVLMDALYVLAEWKNEDVPPWAQYGAEEMSPISLTGRGKAGSPFPWGRKTSSPALKLRKSRGSVELMPNASTKIAASS